MILQKIINRKSWIKNEGTMGFNDYVTKYEDFEDFTLTVAMEASKIDKSKYLELINISYPDNYKAVIIYRQLELTEE